MRKAFSFVEVLISVVVLAMLGMTILRFNSFNKRAMERNLIFNKNILLSSPLIYLPKIDTYKDQDKLYSLADYTHFAKLNDNDRKFLESIKFKIVSKKEDKVYLYSDTGGDHFIDYGNLYLNYDGAKSNFLWIKRSKKR